MVSGITAYVVPHAPLDLLCCLDREGIRGGEVEDLDFLYLADV